MAGPAVLIRADRNRLPYGRTSARQAGDCFGPAGLAMTRGAQREQGRRKVNRGAQRDSRFSGIGCWRLTPGGARCPAAERHLRKVQTALCYVDAGTMT